MKVLLIDNYDSFTYNLYQFLGQILEEREIVFSLKVVRNNELTLKQIKAEKYDRIIISPGPGDPSDNSYFGVCSLVITKLSQELPILGVCLGMQGICHYFGGKIVRAKQPMHGKISTITHNNQGLFKYLPQNLEVMRYHSLIPDAKSFPKDLEITAIATTPTKLKLNQILKNNLKNNLEIMSLRHKNYPLEGVQFHPESFASEGGKKILTNFLFR